MTRYTRIPRKRGAPRRKRPELFTSAPAAEDWASISLRMRTKWWNEKFGQLKCGVCKRSIYTWDDLVADHIIPGKMGGCKDHSESNLQPAHSYCNLLKGSRRNLESVIA